MPFILPDKIYNIITWLLAIVIPAFGTLFSVVANELGFAHTESVLVILFAVATFLGVVLGISNAGYSASGNSTKNTP